jgi:hypothetical protein
MESKEKPKKKKRLSTRAKVLIVLFSILVLLIVVPITVDLILGGGKKEYYDVSLVDSSLSMDETTHQWVVTGSVQNDEDKPIDAGVLDITIDGNAVDGSWHFNLLDIRLVYNHTTIAPGELLGFKAWVNVKTELYANGIYVSIHVYHHGLERDETTLSANLYYS